MKKYFLILLALLSGCTEIGIIEKDIPFEEKNVVYGRLEGGSETVVISFTKSFELNLDYSREEAALDDITAYIWSEVDGIYPLIHRGSGDYVPVDDLNIEHGRIYELHAKINSDRIYCSTYVPELAEVLSVELVENYILCKLNSEPNSVYGCKFELFSKSNAQDSIETLFYEISENYSESKIIELRTDDLPKEYFDNQNDFLLNLKVYAFDKDYHDYYYSRLNNKPVENVFSEGGGSVFWNIQGDNAIGMFLGYSSKTIRNIKFE